MSGGPKSYRGTRINQAPLPSRPDISNPTPPGGLPMRDRLNVVVATNKGLETLARVKKKFQLVGELTLSLELSKYLSETKNEDSVQKKNQLLQAFLHELMHVALWDDVSIVHNPDTESILNYYVEGDTLTPNEWDLKVMKEASERIVKIIIDASQISGLSTQFNTLKGAISMWNGYIGREFFILK